MIPHRFGESAPFSLMTFDDLRPANVFVTERGILRPPYSESLKQAFTQLAGA